MDDIYEYKEEMSEEKKDIFYYASYFADLLFLLGKYENFFDFLHDRDCLNLYIDNHWFRIDEKGDAVKFKMTSSIKERIIENIVSFSSHVNNMILVYLITVLDISIEDYLTCYFISKPEMIKSKIYEEFGKEYSFNVSCFDVLSCDNKKDYIIKIASSAASEFCRGKFEKKIDRIERITGLEFDETIKNGVKEIADKRRAIVHENKKFDFSAKEIKTFINLVISFIEFLGKNLIKNGIDVIDCGLLSKEQ